MIWPTRNTHWGDVSWRLCSWASPLEQEPPASVLLDGDIRILDMRFSNSRCCSSQRDSDPNTRNDFDYLDAQSDHATALRVWGDFLLQGGQFQQAEGKYRTAVKAFKALAEGNPAGAIVSVGDR